MRAAGILLVIGLAAVACDDGTTAPPPTVEGSPAAAMEARVGLLYTVTGEGAGFAQAALGSVPLAVADAEGRGIDLEVLDRDYGGRPDRARALVEELADGGLAGVVVASDDPRLGAALRDPPIPVIHTLVAGDDAVTDESLTFRVAPSNALQAQKLAEYLVAERGYERVSILHEASPFGAEGAADLERALNRLGADVVAVDGFRRGGDVHTAITYSGQQEAQAMVLWARDEGEAGRVTIGIHDARQSYQLALSGNLATFDYGQNAVSQVTPVAFRDGILSVGTWAGPWFDLDRMQGFYERFQEENDTEAPFQAVQIHDALVLLAEATVAGGGEPAAVADALEDTEGFVGAGVPLSFSSQDHEGVDRGDMAILAFTKDPESAGGDFAPDVSTGGGFFTIDTRTVELPPQLDYLTAGLPE
jgi:branched-chain amino acid transport system substrate-binding protein